MLVTVSHLLYKLEVAVPGPTQQSANRLHIIDDGPRWLPGSWCVVPSKAKGVPIQDRDSIMDPRVDEAPLKAIMKKYALRNVLTDMHELLLVAKDIGGERH